MIKNILTGKHYEKLTDYSIHYCKISEIEQVKGFINDYWRKGHILATNDKLVKWQYYNSKLQQYNFAIAKHKSGEIHGIYGFIPVSHFDDNLSHYMDIWLSIWAVRPQIKAPMLGLSLLSYIINTKYPLCIIGIMSSDMAKTLYGNINGFELGMLNQYYIVNKTKKRFELIGNFDGRYCNECGSSTKIEEAGIEDLDDSLFDDSRRVPMKSVEYVKNRFLNHPIYDYKMFKITDSGAILGLIITRVQSYKDSRAIRIVDYYGNEKYLIGLDFQKLLAKYDAEYIDFYNYGFSEEVMSKTSFLKRDRVIVPNYFEPFEKRNIDIDYVTKTDIDFVICKGDAEQDRPNEV